jgi:RimJ/RimL family protein N-acetyltransferase
VKNERVEEIRAKNVRLRPVGEGDLAVIYGLTNDPGQTGDFEWFGWQDPSRYRRRWEQDGLLGDDGGLFMVEGEGPGTRGEAGAEGESGAEGELLGFVSWSRHQTARTSFCWSMGIALLPQARGRGYGTAAQRALVRYLFLHTQVNRIEAGTEVGNLAEQRALEKAGFTREGVMRGSAFQGGRWHDGVIYSVLRSEVEL